MPSEIYETSKDVKVLTKLFGDLEQKYDILAMTNGHIRRRFEENYLLHDVMERRIPDSLEEANLLVRQNILGNKKIYVDHILRQMAESETMIFGCYLK